LQLKSGHNIATGVVTRWYQQKTGHTKSYKGWLYNLTMSWLLNRQEKEDYVIRLYKEGNSIRQIAELVHMSFRDIGAITNKVKSQADRERGYTADEEPKSPEATLLYSKAFKLFAEGKTPIEVVIALDEPGDRVRYMYREYWELTGRYKLAQIYDEARYDLPGLLRLHRIVKDLAMNEHDIKNVFELAKYNELERLQGKVEYLRNEIDMLEQEKSKATHHILKLNRTIDEMQSLAQKSGEMAYINPGTGWHDNAHLIPYSEPLSNSIQYNKESGWYDYPGNLYPTYKEPSSYYILLSYRSYRPWE
jgi:hypothetical protein